MSEFDLGVRYGVHYGVSFEDYQKIDAINFSLLKNISVSPWYYQKMLSHKFDSKSMAFGRAVHAAVFEPDYFDSKYVFYDGYKRGKAWEEFKTNNVVAEALSKKEFLDIEEIKRSCCGNVVAEKYLSSGKAEVTILFLCPTTKIRCKARIDWLADDYSYFLDLKTTQNPTPQNFERQFASYQYHQQFAFYKNAIRAATGAISSAKCLAVRNTFPFDSVLYSVDGDPINEGQKENAKNMELLKSCMMTGYWPHFETEQDLILPMWATTQEQETSLSIGGKKVSL